ncbi:MAG: hypothetical protein ACFE9L_03585 [Candidatus Hodarchaeota archaeon]
MIIPAAETKILLGHFYRPGAFTARKRSQNNPETEVVTVTHNFPDYTIHIQTYGKGPIILCLHDWGGSVIHS